MNRGGVSKHRVRCSQLRYDVAMVVSKLPRSFALQLIYIYIYIISGLTFIE